MGHQIKVLPQQLNIEVPAGANLLDCLRRAGLGPDAPCGGESRCGKCRVLVDGVEQLACRTVVHRDMTVILPEAQAMQVLTDGPELPQAKTAAGGYALAFDLGTTTLAGFLLDGSDRRELARESRPNPQAAFGADVVSRIQQALKGQMAELTGCVRQAVTEMALDLCTKAGIDPKNVTTLCVVGNPAMQQLFMGILPENLARIPFAPALTRAQIQNAALYLPCCENAQLLVVPNVSGFVGADTLACVLATGLDQAEKLTLLVDIGTNGEMVLGNRQRMVACSTAAGPALEGANISCGMTARPGAIDHIWLENGQFRCSVIGGRKAVGICGSGLIDAVAAALDADLLNKRGKILTQSGVIDLTDDLHLTQEDIRQAQLAKGAIAAGIELMARHLGVATEDIQTVYLAGAFGSFLSKTSACRMGLLPPALEEKTRAVGNAAGSGAKYLALDQSGLSRAQEVAERIKHLDLAAHPNFPRTFAKMMMFETDG